MQAVQTDLKFRIIYYIFPNAFPLRTPPSSKYKLTTPLMTSTSTANQLRQLLLNLKKIKGEEKRRRTSLTLSQGSETCLPYICITRRSHPGDFFLNKEGGELLFPSRNLCFNWLPVQNLG